ncbi:MAG: GAF domain-containing protein [Tildeniella nuda ZEHNDER 1965/U140]|jgi:PAS domain S-box-containing protein|nr:GAF domain-containing protein [Tildeniella nuda ZEHNDER 1965/U140]
MARILVVEDEIVSALMIQEFLEPSEHTVVASVASGAEAIRVAVETQPDLVLMDISLEGGLDGIAAATQIHEQLGVPIIYITANAEDQTLQRAVATEPFGYLVKPFNQIGLYTTINIALRRYQLEQQLEQAEQWLTTTLASIGDGTIATDRNGYVTFMNAVAEDLTGWQQTDALGISADLILRLIHSETREAIENPLLQAMRQGVSVSLSNYCVLQTKSGLERAIGDTAAPIRNDKGEITGGVLIFQDVTERRQAEALLHHRQEEFRALAENSPDIVVRFDREFRHVYVNPAAEAATGIPPQAFIGRTNAELGMSTDLLALWNETLQTVLTSGQEQIIEFQRYESDSLKSYQSRVVPEFAQDGSVEFLLCVSRDITEYKQAETILRQQAERERLLVAIAQRVRQSLNLDEILNTTVTEVRQLLQTDRVIMYRFEPDWSGFVIVESVSDRWTPMLGQRLFDPCLVMADCLLPYMDGKVSSTADVLNAGLAQCYVDLLTQFQVRANLVIPVLVPSSQTHQPYAQRQGSHLWGLLAVQQCATPRRWHDSEIELLKNLSAQAAIAIHQSQLYQQTQQQAQREQALNQVIQAIRNSLDLNTIFRTAVLEMGSLLQVEQANILQYVPEQGVWVHQASYRQSPDVAPVGLDVVGLEIPDEGNPITAQLKRLEIVRLDDASTVPHEMTQILAQTFPGAWLAVPLQVGSSVWGNIILIRGPEPFVWQDWQIDLTRAIGDQLAIAIQQSQLYQQVQQLNARLEEQVQERTILLQQAFSFEATLKRIADRVRDSLDEDQILRAVVEELAVTLDVSACSVAVYDLPQQTVNVRYEYTTALALVQGNLIPMAVFPEVYQQLLDGQHFQYCSLDARPMQPRVVRLACPIVDDQGVLGDLRLVNHADYIFSDQEVRLVQQVANQCAIALRQSQLYQSVQAQVAELEQLNRLKDDFVSTVSHELRTPMASIRMAIQMLEVVLLQTEDGRSRDATEPSSLVLQPASFQRVARYFQVLRDECQRETMLIDDLLDLSRLERQTEPLNRTTLDLQPWLTRLVIPFADRVRSQRQRLETRMTTPLPALTTDYAYLERILNELLQNACKYTPADETIILSVQPLEQSLTLARSHVEISVSNSGVEISAEQLERVFDKFYRVPSNNPWQHRGTGLGLALVKKLIEQLQGTIEASSADGWTTFTARIPLESDQ